MIHRNVPILLLLGHGQWIFQLLSSSGLDHLEGRQVAVLADGGVVNGLTVLDGSVTLPAPASEIVVGLPFQAQLPDYASRLRERESIQFKASARR